MKESKINIDDLIKSTDVHDDEYPRCPCCKTMCVVEQSVKYSSGPYYDFFDDSCVLRFVCLNLSCDVKPISKHVTIKYCDLIYGIKFKENNQYLKFWNMASVNNELVYCK